MNGPFRAVIFDMDGLLVDSEPLWQDAEIEVLGALGVPLDRERCRTTQGLRVDEVIAHWHRLHPWTGTSLPEAREAVVARVVQLVETRGELMQGAASAVAACRRKVGRVGVASSSPPRLIEAVLRRFHLEFDVVRSAAGEAQGKPHPAVYLRAAEALGVPGQACLAVEDSIPGIIAAKAARMTCVAVPDPPAARHDPRYAIADQVLESLDEIDAALDRLGAL